MKIRVHKPVQHSSFKARTTAAALQTQNTKLHKNQKYVCPEGRAGRIQTNERHQSMGRMHNAWGNLPRSAGRGRWACVQLLRELVADFDNSCHGLRVVCVFGGQARGEEQY
jgi:hypothetical protein|uniref:Uncharacterized protein n=1 Tax=Eutreptiella gymnastica TaxID=73025 RepID=A0A7S4LE79_9EUGL